MQRKSEQAVAVRRWLAGQAMASARIGAERSLIGPNPRQAVAEVRAAVNALAKLGMWPAPRDAASEAAVNTLRERWARIQNRAMRDRAR